MAEVYDLLMKIGVTGDVLQSLAQISSRLNQIASQVDTLNTKFGKITQTIGQLGLAAAGLGAGILVGLDRATMVYDKILTQQNLLVASGVKQADVLRASNAARETALKLNMSIGALTPTMFALTRQFGAGAAEAILPGIAAEQKALGKLGSAVELEPFLRMLKREDLTPAQTLERIRALRQLQERSGIGEDLAQEYLSIYGRAGAAAPAWSYAFRTQQLPALMEMLPAAARSNLGSLFGQEFTKEIRDPKNRIARFIGPGERLQDISNDPYAFAQSLVRGMRGRGDTVDLQGVTNLLVRKLGLSSQQAESLIPMMLQGEEVRGAGRGPFGERRQMLSVEEIHRIKTVGEARAAAFSAISNAFEEWGRKGLDESVLNKWKLLIGSLQTFTTWIKDQDEKKVKLVTDALVGLGTALLTLGGLAASAWVLRGLAILLTPGGLILGGLALLAGVLAAAAYEIKKAYDEFDVQLFVRQLKIIWAGFSDILNYLVNRLTAIATLGLYGTNLPEHQMEGLLTKYGGFFGPNASVTAAAPALAPGNFKFPFMSAFPEATGGPTTFNERFGAMAGAAVAPRIGQEKTVTAVTNLNISGRQLASAIQYYMVQALESSGGAGASNGVGLPHGPDAQFSSN